MTTNPPSRPGHRPRRPRLAAGALMVLAAATFATVALVHFGVDIPLGFTTVSDSFPGAAPPEAVIAVVVAIGAATVLAGRTNGRRIGLATTAFALLGTAYGLRITANSTRTGDAAYHVSILVALLVILALLLVPDQSGRRPARHAGEDIRSPS